MHTTTPQNTRPRFKDVEHGMGVYILNVEPPTPFRQYWLNKQVLPHAHAGRPLVVADLGAGNGARGGAVLMALLTAGHCVTAHLLDMEAGPLEEAIDKVLPEALAALGSTVVAHDARGLRHRVPRPAGAVQFEATATVGSVTELPFDTGSVDALMCELVLHWLHHPAQVRQALSEIDRVLRPGSGSALLAVLTPWNKSNIRIPGTDPAARWQEVLAFLQAHPGEPFPGTFPNPRGSRLPLLYYPELLFRAEVQRAGLEVTALELLGTDLYRHPEERADHPGSVWLTVRKPACQVPVAHDHS